MQYLAILGRQPKISLAELESLFSDVEYLGENLAIFSAKESPEIARLGGVIKLAQSIDSAPEKFLTEYAKTYSFSGKFVIGISDYSKRGASGRIAQNEALRIKRFLKKQGFSVRVLPNKTADLSSATVFHNQLGEKPGHFEFIKISKKWFVGIGVQNINAYTARDQARPARDAKNGMLPPKLAQILINLCGPLPENARILDPFCGTGVVLQEALLLGYRAYGTDKSERIVGYAKRNLDWLVKSNLAITASGDLSRQRERRIGSSPVTTGRATGAPEAVTLGCADATNFTWQQPIDAVVFEGYLGPPMSQIPAEIKMKSVISDLLLLYYHTLKNLSRQIKSGTPVVMAVPAWLRPDGSYRRLKLLDEAEELGYNVVKYKSLSFSDLLYHREGQVVAREIIVLRKK